MDAMTAATGFDVPLIDISPYTRNGDPADRAVVAARFDDAASSVGFIQVVGHEIPAAVIDEFTAAMDVFFALPLELKKTYRTPPEINRGYAPPKSESLSLSLGVESAARMNDFFEAFNVGTSVSDFPDAELITSHYAENTWPDDTAVFEAAVVGRPDTERGAVVCAFVVLRDGEDGGAAMVRRIQDGVKARLAPYKYPRDVRFVDALPRNPSGKLQHFRLREQLAREADAAVRG